MRALLPAIALCAVACVENPSPEYKSAYAYSHIQGTLVEYTRGRTVTTAIDHDAGFAAAFENSDFFFPQSLDRIDQADGRFRVHFKGSKITPETGFDCLAPAHDTLRCPVDFTPIDTTDSDTLVFALHGERIGAPVFSYRIIDSVSVSESLLLFSDKEAAHFDSVISAGKFDTLRCFRGEYLYQ